MMEKDIRIIKGLCCKFFMIEDTAHIVIKRLGGLTNRNYKVVVNGQEYVFRLPGQGTEELINREEEHICTSLANEINVDSELIYFENMTGIKISKFIYEAETMDKESVKKRNNMQAIAEIFKQLHFCNIIVPVEFNVFEKIEKYENLLKKCGENFLWEDYMEVKKKVINLKEKTSKMNVKSTICHNDPLCENFVKGKEKMYLVDWEYAGMNDPMWDLADLFIEAEFTQEEEFLFHKLYFGQEADSKMKSRILINKIFLDFLWSLWGIQRYSCGEDLLEYANQRFIRAKKNLQLLSGV